MGNGDYTLTVYSSQSRPVVQALMRDGHCFSRKEYVEKKYEESAKIFVSAYGWFAQQAQKHVKRPQGAEYPYWGFLQLHDVDQSSDVSVLKLRVPADQAIFFDMHDWIKILRLQYIGETEADEKQFRQMLAAYGVRREMDIMLTDFYPDLKRQVRQSWDRLFRYHDRIRAGELSALKSVQVGLWQLKKEWLAQG